MSPGLPLDRLILSGSRTPIGEATAADFELAQNYLRDEDLERACWKRWLELIAAALPPGKTVQEVLSLEQLRTMRYLAWSRRAGG
jgi:hypothetical protein